MIFAIFACIEVFAVQINVFICISQPLMSCVPWTVADRSESKGAFEFVPLLLGFEWLGSFVPLL